METLGGRLQLHVRGGGGTGGGSRFPSQFGPALPSPPLPFLWVSPHTHSHTCLPVPVQVIRPPQRCSQTTAPSSPVHLPMTHCATEAKPACVCAVTGLIRALRSRLKALRRLLVLRRTDGSRQRPAQSSGGARWERPGLLNGINGRTDFGCCGPAHPSTAVSYPECVWVMSKSFFCVRILSVSLYKKYRLQATLPPALMAVRTCSVIKP